MQIGVIQAVVLALVQAATEFLPVSSSGHLLFFKGLFGAEDFPILFDIVVHVGSLTAILLFYRRRIVEMFHGAYLEVAGKRSEKSSVRFLAYILVSTTVTFVFYWVFRGVIESRYASPGILPMTFLFTTGILLLAHIRKNGSGAGIGQRGAGLPITAGLLQGIAIFPGVSRSGATISALILWGVDRDEAAFYSFFLAVPAILGALFLKLLELESVDFIASAWGTLVLSYIVSASGSLGVLALLNILIRRRRFWLFAFYTLMMSIVSFVLFVA